MSTTRVIGHHVADYGKWRAVYDKVEPLRAGVDAPPRIEVFASV